MKEYTLYDLKCNFSDYRLVTIYHYWNIMQIHYANRITTGDLPPLELLKVSYTDHCFPRHWDETYIIQIVEDGINSFYCRGEERVAPAGSVVLINPGDIHSGCSADRHRLVYRTMYPTVEWMTKCIEEYGDGTRKGLPLFTSPVVMNPRIVILLLGFHECVNNQGTMLYAESMLFRGMQLLLHSCSGAGIHEKRGNEPAAVARAKEFIQAHYPKNISLTELSTLTNLSPSYLVRSFRKHFGQPPHEYLLNVRIQRSKVLLRSGESITGAAFKTGFSDQSHFHRHFKRIFGMTPGEYIRQGNFIQDIH